MHNYLVLSCMQVCKQTRQQVICYNIGQQPVLCWVDGYLLAALLLGRSVHECKSHCLADSKCFGSTWSPPVIHLNMQ